MQSKDFQSLFYDSQCRFHRKAADRTVCPYLIAKLTGFIGTTKGHISLMPPEVAEQDDTTRLDGIRQMSRTTINSNKKACATDYFGRLHQR